jgi:prevent-host-death family protein
MSTLTIADVQARLPELVDQLRSGEEVLITRDGSAVARLMSADRPTAKQPRLLGRMAGTVVNMALNFDSPLDDFKEYMS